MTLAVLALAFFFFAWRRTLTYLHMFQQDDYDSARFIGWVVKRRVFDRKATLSLAALSVPALLLPVFAPLFTMVPSHAAGIALIIIGSFMIQPITRLDFDDFTELIPAFLTVVLMIFTYNIGVGMTTGLLSYPLIKLLTGRVREVSAGMWVLAALSLSFFILMPKG